MASNDPPEAAPHARQRARRLQTIGEALDAAVAIMAREGVGGLSMSEVARRLGIRQPSLYKYFASLHALYDALFAQGVHRSGAAVRAAAEQAPRGVPRIRAATRALVRWAVDNPELAQLLFWRPVPGFAPSPQTFEHSVRQMDDVAAELAEAVRLGELHRDATRPEALRLYTVVISGVVSQQLANEPGAAYETGAYTRLTDTALDLFLARYTPTGANDADPRP